MTPIVVEVQGKPQLISCGGDVVQAFEPRTGNIIWSAKNFGEGVIPSAVSGENMVFTASGWDDPTIRAFRLGGNGDITSTHTVWELRENVPMIPSFLYHNSYLYSLTGRGKAMCLSAKTGEIIWEQSLGGGRYSASPVYADGKIYFLSNKGVTTIIEAGPVFKEIAKNDIGESCRASYAISNGKILIRGEKHLFCISKE
jgi:outer membrane protein assembly factor BamB